LKEFVVAMRTGDQAKIGELNAWFIQYEEVEKE